MSILLAKYFSRRHVEIANIRHIIVSGVYAFILSVLVALQPDFGGAVIIMTVWLGMVLVSGISKKHLAALFIIGLVVFAVLWNFGLAQLSKRPHSDFSSSACRYSRRRIQRPPSDDRHRFGRNFRQRHRLWHESRLKFLPEYQTDFIFAAFAEEWGFVGIIIFFTVFGVLIWRIIAKLTAAATNFETFFGLGLAYFFPAHLFINVADEMGLLPVTGITLSFVFIWRLAFGVVISVALGILVSMRKYILW